MYFFDDQLLANFGLFLQILTWKNFQILKFFFLWISTILDYIDPQQKIFVYLKPLGQDRILSKRPISLY